MTVIYDIFPDMNLVVYVCTGITTPTEFFTAGDAAALDPRLKAKMKIIIDFFSADLETSVSDLHFAIKKNFESKQKGLEVGQTAVLTTSQAMNYLGDALKLLSLDAITNFGVFHTELDVINWLGLPQEETTEIWRGLKVSR